MSLRFLPDWLARRMAMQFSVWASQEGRRFGGEESRACFSHLRFNMPIDNFSGTISGT